MSTCTLELPTGYPARAIDAAAQTGPTLRHPFTGQTATQHAENARRYRDLGRQARSRGRQPGAKGAGYFFAQGRHAARCVEDLALYAADRTQLDELQRQIDAELAARDFWRGRQLSLPRGKQRQDCKAQAEVREEAIERLSATARALDACQQATLSEIAQLRREGF